MKRLILSLFIILVACISIFSQTNSKHVRVKGYYRSDGTYVQPHYRTAPNSTNMDNFSTKGNINPYTGKPGWVKPDNYSSEIYNIPQDNSYDKKHNPGSKYKFLGTTNSSGQKVISYDNGKEVFGLCTYCKDISYKENTDYYWYTPHSGVQKTQGSAEGTLLNGEYKFFNKEGELVLKSNYDKGVIHGEQIFWDFNGVIKEKRQYTYGELDYLNFRNDDYIVEWIGALFKQGSVKNIYTSYGRLVETSTVLDSLKFHSKLYDEQEGYLESEFTRSMVDLYYGTYKVYHANSNIKFIGYFTDGFKNKVWTWYDENGELDFWLEYRIWEINNSEGILESKGSQYFDKKNEKWVNDGLWVNYKKNGVDWNDFAFFENGVKVHKK